MPNYSDLINERLTKPQQQIEKIQTLLGEIEDKLTNRPLVVYAADLTKSHPMAPNTIYLLDKTIFGDLLDSVAGNENIDVLIQSPGGYLEATEKMATMLRARFTSVHFYVPHTAKSAATMLVCSGDKVFMTPLKKGMQK